MLNCGFEIRSAIDNVCAMYVCAMYVQLVLLSKFMTITSLKVFLNHTLHPTNLIIATELKVPLPDLEIY